MPSRKRSVEIEVVVDDKTATKSLRNIDTQVQKSGKMFSNLGTAVKAGLAAVGAREVLGVLKDMTNSAVDLNESVNAVNVTFGDSAAGILELGENAAESMGLATSEFNQFAVMFSAFAEQVANATGQDVVSVMDQITTRVADFASVMNLDVAEAGEIFQSIMAGSTEVARRFGLDVSAATVEQYLLTEGIASSKSEITEADKVLGRYSILIQQTDKFTGDFANTSEDLANASRIAAAELENLQAELGQRLIPIVLEGTNKTTAFFDVIDSDVNLGWSQRLSAAFQLATGESAESVEAYIEQKETLNDLGSSAAVVGGGVRREVESMAESADRALRNKMIPAVKDTEEAFFDAADGVYALDAALRQTEFGRARQAVERAGGGGPVGFTAEDRARQEGALRQRHEGGMVPGTPGEEVPIMAQAGEMVTRRAAVGGGGESIVIPIYIGQQKIDEVVVSTLNRYNRRNGTVGF